MIWRPSLSLVTGLAALAITAFPSSLGCAPSGPAVETSKDVVVTEKDANHEVSIARGGTLIVRLGAQLGTGYGWEIAGNEPSSLRPVAPPELDGSRQDRPGAIQYQVFRFAAEKPGTIRLALRYVRPWEKDAQAARTFTVDVTVR